MKFSRRGALVLAPVFLGVGALLAPATPAQAAGCSYRGDASTEYEYAGNYSGLTVVPSKTSVTSAGVEAQCLLLRLGYNPGPVDGVFGSKSQAAMKQFQQWSHVYGSGLSVDGMPGPKSWPWLRWLAYS